MYLGKEPKKGLETYGTKQKCQQTKIFNQCSQHYEPGEKKSFPAVKREEDSSARITECDNIRPAHHFVLFLIG